MSFVFRFIVIYLVVVALVYVFQRNLQYFPHKDDPGLPEANGLPEMKKVTVATADGLNLFAWFAPPKEKDGKIIVFYHGNAGHVGHRVDKAREMIDAGYGVFFAEYRGFGGNPGKITEEGFYHDARAALKWLGDNGYSAAQWVIYGESIGSGPAVQMAMESQVKYLVLEAPFTSAVDVGKRSYFWLPVSLLLKDRYDNISKIKDVKASLLVVHGDNDEAVPYHFGKELFEAANSPKMFVTVHGGRHNDLYALGAGKAVIKWLEEQK